MSRRSPAAVVGAAAEPDVDPDSLEIASLGDLARGFEFDDARFAEPVSLADSDAPYGRFERVLFDAVSLAGSRLKGVTLRDVIARRVDGSNASWPQASANRAEFADCRMTGIDLGESDLRQTVFRNCKLDYANFRMSSLANVTFEDCVLVDADFGGAKLEQVRFSGCEMRDVEFSKARLSDVDLRGSDLSVRGSATALRGAIVSPLQLMELSAVLAQEAGIRVED